jgi:pSer/pThr/pTyr-binding forkhead associated (FHA) protein
MSTPIEKLLPEWRSEPSTYMNKLLTVFKKGEHVDDVTIPNKKDHIIFGRKKDTCDIVLEHQSISRQHAVVFFGEMGAVYLMDLGSSHGTHVDNEPLTANTPVLLTAQHEIVFGQSSRKYKLCAAPKKPSVPLFTGKNAFDIAAAAVADKDKELLPAPPAPLSSTERQKQERQQRQAEIAAMAQEMATTVPIFQKSVQVTAANRDDLNKVCQQDSQHDRI